MSASVSQAPNRAIAFATALFQELVRAGVGNVCICPGSRSAPLAVAAARQPGLRCWSHIDERSAGFFALGLARASGDPVALVCTSGTAAANFLPAVVEAHYACVPLVVLTADRPPELREWGAGQTIDQLRLYGSHVRWFAEVALPAGSADRLRYARALACRAVDAAVATPAGPVHLNLPFREPLEPRAVPGDLAPDLEQRAPLAARGRGERPYATVRRGIALPTPDDIANLAERMSRCERGVVACGPLDASPDLVEAIARLAQRLGWPILAEPTSQLRRGPHVPHAPVVASADLLLRDHDFAASHTPDFVLRFGATPTSKSLRQWFERRPPRDLVLVDAGTAWHDPSHLASEVLRVDATALCDLLVRRLASEGERGRSPWLRGFLEADARARAAIDAQLGADSCLLEARVVRELAEAVPDDALLYVSNSMPIRDLDAFLPASPGPLRVLCNRGANGIDGMVSSALGAAAAGTGPVVLLSGDLALLHDSGGLLAARRLGVPLVIVVLDNDGGGIFSRLPIADHGDSVAFQEHFRTPHGLDLGALCRGIGLEHAQVESAEHLRATLKDALAGSRVRVLSVPLDPERSAARFQEMVEAVAAAIRASERMRRRTG